MRHASAIGVHYAKIVLRHCQVLFGCLAKPSDGLAVILLQAALAFVIYQAEDELCLCIALFSSLAKPKRIMFIISRHTLAIGIHHTEIILRLGITLFSLYTSLLL